ncbi:MAG: S-layer homology domain-containing protein, partial [Clostridia bacterium]|nr:S-layer homology domain-containing protein [Clostridia bacterium]
EKEKEEKEKEETKPFEEEKENKKEFTDSTFKDVKKESWYYDSVKYCFENSLMEGTGDYFEPDTPMTRAMLVTILFRLSGSDAGKVNPFSDVDADSWYSDAVMWASENGIVKGITETKFAPDEKITREQAVTVIVRYLYYIKADVNEKADLSSYNDSENISPWAADAFSVAVKAGIVTGTSEETLSPDLSTTRAEIATIVMRLCENILK